MIFAPDDSESIYSFQEDHCGDCVHDVNEDCPHLAAAFRGEVRVWWIDADNNTGCYEKRLHGETPRCPLTMELPLDGLGRGER